MKRLELLSLFLSIMTLGCGSSQQAKIRAYQEKEAFYTQQYTNGDILTAKKALEDYLALVERGETSGVKFVRFEREKGLIKARLSLICSKLGEQESAARYLRESVIHAEHNDQIAGKTYTEQQVLDAVNKLDGGLKPKWRKSS